jgi:hypothetical protein
VRLRSFHKRYRNRLVLRAYVRECGLAELTANVRRCETVDEFIAYRAEILRRGGK